MRKKIDIIGWLVIAVLGLTGAAGLIVALAALVTFNLIYFVFALAEGAAFLVGAAQVYGHKFGKVVRTLSGFVLALSLLAGIYLTATTRGFGLDAVFAILWGLVKIAATAHAIFKLVKNR